MGSAVGWRAANPESEPYGTSFRTCAYCGSIHPGDLLEAIEKGGVTFDVADWKYGWPHKAYVNGIPNPIAGKDVRMGSRSHTGPDGVHVNEPLISPAPKFSHAKWYNLHLLDDGFDTEAQTALIEKLAVYMGIQFRVEGDELLYSRAV